MRFATLCLALSCLAGCHDVREFSGSWTGPGVGDAVELRVGFAGGATASLEVQEASLRQFRGRLTTSDDVFDGALIQPIAGAEADVLASVSFDGSPLRVFFAFAETADGGGEATCVVALYPDDRIELRVMRGGTAPLYGIFALERP